MRKAIITGATGAIGTALIKELIEHDIEVLVFTREDSKRNENIPKHKLVKIKYCSLEEISTVENDIGYDFDVFYHLAWSGTTGSGRNDLLLQEKNVEYALDAVRCAKRFGCKKFIGIGSQAEYGRVDVPLRSDTPCHPENEYGKAKLKTGIRVKELAHDLGMEFNWVRVLSVYGPNDNANTMVSYLIETLKKKETPDLTAGEQVWDYLYSGDAAKALRLIADKGVDGKTYVLGSGEEKTLKQYIEEIRDCVSPDTELGFGRRPYAENQVMFLRAEISELNHDTGWKPETSFSDGIRSLIITDKKGFDLFQFIKFGLVGVSNTAISLGIYYLFLVIDKKLYLIGSIVGFIVSVLNSFYWNNKYVFKTQGQSGLLKRLLKTYLSYGGSTVLSTILLYLEVEHFGVSENIAPIINLIITVPLNYIVNKFWAFKKK